MEELATTYGWAAAFGWNTAQNPCPTTGFANWSGVTCNRAGRVTIIVAVCGAQQLNAPIPPILSQLSALTSLDIRECGLTGSILDSFGSMTPLTRLRLDGNVLTGPIPDSLATLPNLGYLALAGNLLTGPIPDFPNSAFAVIDLAGNFLNEIPASWTAFNRDLSYNCYPAPLPPTCDSQSDTNSCTPNRQDCPGTVILSNVSGDGQTTEINSPFANPLVVSVTDLSSNPVAGVTVTFSGPGILTTTAATGANGQASAYVQANSTLGGNTVTASVSSTVMSTFGLTASDSAACSTTFVVTSNLDPGPGTLRQALADVCPGGTVDLSGIAGQTIALSPGATAYNFSGRLYIATDVTILGRGVTISGSGATRIFFVQNGNVTLEDLTLTDGAGQGGASQYGGSAAGMGGAIFENNGNLTLNGVTLSGNEALGGSTDSSGNGQGGGFGANSTGGDLGGITGTGDGAGGIVQGVGGIGGFGAGGGEGTYLSHSGGGEYGGNGGFGGGSGSGALVISGGSPGYGANGFAGYGGGSADSPGAGGGAGFGGAIFVRNGSLNLIGVTFSGNRAVAGNGAQGKGGSLFIYNGANLNEVPANLSFSGSVAASAGLPGQGYSSSPYNNNATCPGVDTVDICGVVPTNTLTVSVSGNGSVTDSTNLINCPSSNCAALLASGTTLTAVPAGNSYFVGWQGGGCSGTGTCVVSIAGGNVSVTANFALKTNPAITWANPANLTFGSALGSLQLDATANVAGTFSYTPPSGTVLPVGSNQTLSTTFTPSDTIHYNTVSDSVLINVLGSGATATNLVLTTVLTRAPSTNDIVATITIANTGSTPAANVQLTSAAIGSSAAITTLPVPLGTIGGNGLAQTVVTFPASAGSPGSKAALSLAGTYTGGTFSSSSRVTLP